MLCLKAEAFDDHDLDLVPTIDGGDKIDSVTGAASASSSSSSTSFVLPISFGSSLHKYFWKMGKVSTRSISSGGDASPSCSASDFEDTNTQDQKSEPVQDGDISLYKHKLEQDVKMLQQKLQQEIDLRLALANAVEHSNSFSESPCQLPDKAQELLDGITVLEDTVSNLEQKSVSLQYQLSQERNERRIAEYRLKHLPILASSMFDSFQSKVPETITRPGSRQISEEKMEGKPPWSDLVKEPNSDYFVEKLWHRPNQLSEAMVLCMRDIFLFLADSSKISSSKSTVPPYSPKGQLPRSCLASFSDSHRDALLTRSSVGDMEQNSEDLASYLKFDPYGVPGKVEWSDGIGAYRNAVEVSWLSVGKKELEYASGALKRFRLLVEQLVEVDPSHLDCNEKLAFWINVYNALIMHMLLQAFLAYGVPRSDIKLFSLMQKSFVLALQKLKATDELKSFSIAQPEPLLAFALSCGMYSSPAVRIFKPENVNEILVTSLKDYAQASVGIGNKGKILVPKLLHCFAKGIVDDSQLPEWLSELLSVEQASMVKECSSNRKWKLLGARSFSVLPFDSRFRFLFLL
ncbi:hypothetical protein LINPERHAP1_LOCUS12669 [Linum perenne]